MRAQDKELVEHMYAVANKLVREIDPVGEYTFGFHHPYVNSVPHLHMHALIHPFNNWFKKDIECNQLTFVSPEKIIKKLK